MTTTLKKIDYDESERSAEQAIIKNELSNEVRENSPPDSNPEVKPPYHILVVDDDPLIGSILQVTLGGPDREVLACTSGEKALALIAENGISLILLDLILPDMDGRRFLHILRERADTAGIPVIILSALDDAASKIQCFGLGIETFFVKPFDPKILSAAVEGKLAQLTRTSSKALQDPLTGLWNRAAFKDAFTRTKSTLIRARKPLSVATLDFDRFKLINDTFGHTAGDEVLRRCAAVIRGGLRNDDVLARWGGEEFVVLLPNSDVKNGVIAIQKALDAVRAEVFSFEKTSTGGTESVPITFSAGVATVTSGADLEQSICDADRCLYRAKAAGRNRIVSPADDMVPVKTTILLADDDKLVTSFMQHKLEKEGFDVVVFHNGAAVLEMAPTEDIALCILDLHMPGMNGFGLLANLRKNPAFANTPIMLLTALGGDKAIIRGMELGADEYIVKPFSAVELLARVRRLLKKRHREYV